MTTLYDKTGAAYIFDHEHNGTAYVRPLVKVLFQSNSYDDYHEEEGTEPAAYLVALDRSSLSDVPPLAVVNEEVAAKKAELDALKAEAKKTVGELKAERQTAERELQNSKRQLAEWMRTHKVMIDLGKLLEGKVLFPLSVSKSHYHAGQEIPEIPNMDRARYLALESGDFEKGRAWVCKKYGDDHYGSPFQCL